MLKYIATVFVLMAVVGCGPVPSPNKPLFKVAGWQFQRADCESMGNYLEKNAAAITLVEQLGGSIIQALAEQQDGPLVDGKAGLDYLGIGLNVLHTQLSLGIRPAEIPNTFVFRPLTCHELVKTPGSSTTVLTTIPNSNQLKLEVAP